MEENTNPVTAKKTPCYFWRIYKYYVDADQITLKGWVNWCDELYQIQHGKIRTGKIFVNSGMKRAMVKGRVWNKDRIEKWLTDHGYKWTCEEEIHYQYPVADIEQVRLIDADKDVQKKGA